MKVLRKRMVWVGCVFLLCGGVFGTPESLWAQGNTPLKSEFQKAQASELGAMEHRQEVERREWAEARRFKLAEAQNGWQKKKDQIFKTVFGGAARRLKLNELDQEKRQWETQENQELDRLKQEHRMQRQSLIEQHRKESIQFEDALKRGETPSRALWPETRGQGSLPSQSPQPEGAGEHGDYKPASPRPL